MTPTIALAGRPNTGKTTLFNALTGMRQRVANFSGTTVESAVGLIQIEEVETEIIDLPGTSSLLPATNDEFVAFDYLAAMAAEGKDFQVLCVAEASNLLNDMTLAICLAECGYKVSLVVNMIDEAVLNGIRIDHLKLEEDLGMRVVLASGRTGQGLKQISQIMGQLPPQPPPAKALNVRKTPRHELKAIHESAMRRSSHAARRAVARSEMGTLPTIAKTIALDRRLFHPVAGPLILAFTLFAVFESLFTWSAPIRDAMAYGLAWVSGAVRPVIPSELLSSLVCDGIIAGFAAVVLFLPQIAILFALIGFLEASGYLPRAGVMVDRALRPFGLDGKVFIPFLSSFACAIPGVMATRTIPNEKRRLTAVLLSPLMTCSARIPVYTLIIGAFVPSTFRVLGFNGQGVVLAAMYVFGIATALALALALKMTPLYEKHPSPLTVLPPYRFPKPRELFRYVWIRCWHFVSKAGKIIFLVSLLLWALGSFPRTSSSPALQMENSFLGRLGKTIEPIFRPLGYDWKISVGVLSSLAAREVFVGTLGTIFALSAESEGPDGLIRALRAAKTPEGAPRYTLATAVSLLIFFALAMQCISTISVVRRETGGWKWPAIQFSVFFTIAYSLAWLGYRLTGVLIR